MERDGGDVDTHTGREREGGGARSCPRRGRAGDVEGVVGEGGGMRRDVLGYVGMWRDLGGRAEMWGGDMRGRVCEKCLCGAGQIRPLGTVQNIPGAVGSRWEPLRTVENR